MSFFEKLAVPFIRRYPAVTKRTHDAQQRMLCGGLAAAMGEGGKIASIPSVG